MGKTRPFQILSHVLLVSVPSSHKNFVISLLPDAHIESIPLSQTLAQKYPYIRILSVFIHDPIKSDILKIFPNLEAVITRSAGYDHLPLEWMKKNTVAGYYLGDYSTKSVAEFTVGLILALIRRIPEGSAVTKKLKWDRLHLVNQSLKGTTVGVLGTGKIGKAVIHLLLYLGAHVIGYDIVQNKSLKKLKRFSYRNDFRSFLSQSNVLTIHVPLNSRTKHIINKKALQSLPKGAYVINTSRGGTIDQSAMEETLRSGHIAGYGADVLPGEPQPPDLKRFRRFENVILTPHLAAYDKNTIRKRYEYTDKVIRAILNRDQKTLKSFRII